MPEATAADVRQEIETYLDDETIEGADDDADDDGLIGKVARKIDRDDDVPELDDQDRADLEALLTAIHIATRLDRAESRSQSGRSNVTYEEEMVEELRSDARALGATDELLGIGTTKQRATIGVPKTRDW